MKVGVVGTRDFENYETLKNTLDTLEITCIISGGAKGADTLAELYAKNNGIDTIIHRPDWSVGKKGAAIRNAKIVEDSDIIVAFWDGVSRGTKMTMEMAKKANMRVVCIVY
jgi:hypothetical protein